MEQELKIRIGDREELIYMLAEAAAIEHNVMCCYLYGLWSLKHGVDDGLTQKQDEAVETWREALTMVAIEEMSHLAIVANLTVAIGGSPHFSRPNFPIPAGYHPADIDLELMGFCHGLIDHAIYLERPEGIELKDAPEFVHPDHYHRAEPKGMIMPNAQDYNTIGHLYRGIYHGFEVLARRYGEEALFVGNVDDQLGPADIPAPGLRIVTDLASAHAAIGVIVEQGEGAPGHTENSHYAKFIAMKAEYEALLAEDPGFEPAFPVARNPVSREPQSEAGRVWITDPEAAKVLDLANSAYNLMLRLLAQSYGRDPGEAEHKRLFATLSREMMSVLTFLAEYLARLPAGPEHPGVNAGMTFTMVRDLNRLPPGRGEMVLIRERLGEIADHAAWVFPPGHELASLTKAIRGMAERATVPRRAGNPAKGCTAGRTSAPGSGG